jgi:hypothetical protein
MDPSARLVGEDPAGWNRYDTPGSTIHISDTDEIASAPTPSKLGSKHPMQKDADFMGMTLDEYIRGVNDDWGNQVTLGCLAGHWGECRSIYHL